MADWHRIWLRKLVAALPCDTFDVRIISLASKVTEHRVFTPQQFIDAADWMAAMSAARHHVFFRPDGPLTHVLVDDMSEDALHLMACDGVRPSAVVETSVGSLQAWVTLTGRGHDKAVHAATCRILAERYAGDFGSAKPAQHGRVPTTRNPKPERAMSDGTPPLVLLRQHGRHFNKRLFEEARQQAEAEATHASAGQVHRTPINDVSNDGNDSTNDAILRAMFDEALARHGDRSTADAHVATFLLANGTKQKRVASLLLEFSDKAREREVRKAGDGVRYVEQTIEGALRQLERINYRHQRKTD